MPTDLLAAARGYAQLPDDEQCITNSIAELTKLRAELVESKQADLIEVQAIGPAAVELAKDFVHRGFRLVIEENYELGKDLKLNLQHVEEYFLIFADQKNARLAIENGRVFLGPREITVVKPTRPAAVRETFGRIGGLLTRLAAIDAELAPLCIQGLATGRLVANPRFLSFGVYDMEMPKWKRQRDDGESLDDQAYATLRKCKPVDMKLLNAAIKRLRDEASDILIELRALQRSGVDFEF